MVHNGLQDFRSPGPKFSEKIISVRNNGLELSVGFLFCLFMPGTKLSHPVTLLIICS